MTTAQKQTVEFTENAGMSMESDDGPGGLRSTIPGVPIEIITGSTACGGPAWRADAPVVVQRRNQRNFRLIHAALDMQGYRSQELASQRANWAQRPQAVIAQGRLRILSNRYSDLSTALLNNAVDGLSPSAAVNQEKATQQLSEELMENATQQEIQRGIIENKRDYRLWASPETLTILLAGLRTSRARFNPEFWDGKWQKVHWDGVSFQERVEVPGWGAMELGHVYLVNIVETVEGTIRRIRVDSIIWHENLQDWLGGMNPHTGTSLMEAPPTRIVTKEEVEEAPTTISGFKEPNDSESESGHDTEVSLAEASRRALEIALEVSTTATESIGAEAPPFVPELYDCACGRTGLMVGSQKKHEKGKQHQAWERVQARG
jgi:hypothetical protein